jgi:Tn3 transposase DDE domain
MSGNDPKLKDPFGRYVITTFAGGTIARLNEAITDLVNAHARLDLSRAWGRHHRGCRRHPHGHLPEQPAGGDQRPVRKPGGIAYHHIADTYIALFTHFIPCGVWEAVYIIAGLLKNVSEVQPSTIHADTQGQSLPVFSLAHLLGFAYVHIDALFGEPGQNVIDFDLIEAHFKDLMRVAISVREGMRRRVTAATNKVEAFNGFSEWVHSMIFRMKVSPISKGLPV